MKECQYKKESAVYIAVRSGFGLVRRNGEIHKIYPSGEMKFLVRKEHTQTEGDLWTNAYIKLKNEFGFDVKHPLKRKEEKDPNQLELPFEGKHILSAGRIPNCS